MPWQSGSFGRTNGVNTGSALWDQDRLDGTKIRADRHDTHDQDLADGIDQCVQRGGQNAATANLPMGGWRHTGVGAASARDQYATAGQVQDGALAWGGDAGGSANAYTVALAPPLAAYAAGQRLAFVAGFGTTGAATLSVNGLAAQALRKLDGSAIGANDIRAGDLVWAVHDGTAFRVDLKPLSSVAGDLYLHARFI